MICPKCQDLMRTISRGSVHVDQCDNCKGVFLDGGELEQIIAAERAHYAQPYRPEGPPIAAPTMMTPVGGELPTPVDAPVHAPVDPPPVEPGDAPSGPPPPYQPPPGTPPASTPGVPQGLPPGAPPPYQPPPGTVPGPPPPAYPGGYYDHQHYGQRRRRSFLEELLD